MVFKMTTGIHTYRLFVSIYIQVGPSEMQSYFELVDSFSINFPVPRNRNNGLNSWLMIPVVKKANI